MTTQSTASTHGILATGVAPAFELTRRRPSDDLAEYIERHWIVRWNVRPGAVVTQELLPHPCVNLVTEADRAAVHGMAPSRARQSLRGAGIAAGTKFRPGAFVSFVDVPGRALLGATFALPTLFGASGGELEAELLSSAGDPDAHVELVEAFLRDRLPAPDPRLRLLSAIIGEMLAGHSELTVRELADRFAVSSRTLHRLFGDYVGVAPKWLLRRYRVHEAAERIAAGETVSAVRLAADLGYFDQSHFIRDFRDQVGCSPGRYAQLCAAARRPLAVEEGRSRAA
jgi:AraC-like DNA-binding protein